MNYLAVTQQTAKWLIEKKNYLSAVEDELPGLSNATSLMKTVLTAGAIRAAASEDGRLLALWNSDYLTNRGDESWGIIRLNGAYGLLSSYIPEVFERELQIICQRIDGLLLDPRWMHKLQGGSIHSCIAGRGAEAREYWVMYGDNDIHTGAFVSRGVICLGPERGGPSFLAAARHDYESLAQFVRTANRLVATSGLRPVDAASHFAGLSERFIPVSATEPQPEPGPAMPVPALQPKSEVDVSTEGWTFAQWTAEGSPLTSTQRRILESDIADRQPLRISGAAGSGKTLLMMLLAIRMLRRAAREGRQLRVLYIVHNSAMQEKVWFQFLALGASEFLEANNAQELDVSTLFQYSRKILQISDLAVIDLDAQASKAYQLAEVSKCLRSTIAADREVVSGSNLLSEVARNEELFPTFASLAADEIGLAIKGHALADDRKTYVGSERRLSRLHGILNHGERGFMFDVFEAYRRAVFEDYELFDTDDLAMSLQLRLTTPVWALQRRKLGYDYVFVDETQLFNENERRLFPLLTKGTGGHVPVVLALDEAQQTRAIPSAGLALLGFEELSHESLESVHRSTKSILKLAFFVIQRTTDLFGSDFPDFTGTTDTVLPDTHKLARLPEIRKVPADSTLGLEVIKQVETMRRANLRQISVVCHAERYWDELEAAISNSSLPFIVLNQRGERIEPKRPVVILARPDTVGGQEFDGVIAVGLEQGVVPPRVQNPALATALEQQTLRELYVSFTRAKYRLVLVNSHGSAPTGVIAESIRRDLIRSIATAPRRKAPKSGRTGRTGSRSV